MTQQTIDLKWYDPIKVSWSLGWRYFIYSVGLMGVSAAIMYILTYLNVNIADPEINSKLMFFFIPFEVYIYYLPYKKLNGLTYRTFKIIFPQPNTIMRRLKLILSYIFMSFLVTALLLIIFLAPFFLVAKLKESMDILIALGAFIFVSIIVVHYFILRRWMTTGIFGQHLILIPRPQLGESVTTFEN